MPGTAIMWFRRDLRLADNAALSAAVATGRPIATVFVQPAETPSGPGAASGAWLARSLASLDSSLRARGCVLSVEAGLSDEILRRTARQCEAREVYCSRDWTPDGLAEERRVSNVLGGLGVALRVFESQLLVTPRQLLTAQGTPYRVFTPFYRAWLKSWDVEGLLPAPADIATAQLKSRGRNQAPSHPAGLELENWWRPGEADAQARLWTFVAQDLAAYADRRDIPAEDGTSRLSPALAWGELSPRQVAEAALESRSEAVGPFVRQLAWREFAYHVLYHHPDSARESLDARFSGFPWLEDPAALEAWKSGLTGYPLVDAGMRQLLATGWIHNRVRLLCASFLTKDLLVPWQIGEQYFRDRLVDYDPAINPFNWQWVAGCGADAAPYFRVFSPTRQAERFDVAGTFIREWVPELCGLSGKALREPWTATADELGAARVELGRDYPMPIVDHSDARLRALAAFSAISGLSR